VSLSHIKGLERTTPEFRTGLVELARRLGIEPDWLGAVIAYETAYTWAPNICSGAVYYRGPLDDGRAVGLIQFTRPALEMFARAGWPVTKAELAALSAEAQLLWVERYFRAVGAVGRMRNVGDVYMAVFAPAAVGKPDSMVLYRAPSSAHTANRHLDRDHDGAITRAEAIRDVETVLAQAQARGPLEVADPLGPFLLGLGILRWLA